MQTGMCVCVPDPAVLTDQYSQPDEKRMLMRILAIINSNPQPLLVRFSHRSKEKKEENNVERK